MKALSICPPLTSDNILTLKGQPVTKMINPNQRKNVLAIEEWIYYNVSDREQECFSFKDGTLINWTKKPI